MALHGRDAIHRVSTTDGTSAGRDAIHRVSTIDGTDAGTDAMNRVSTTDRALSGGATGERNPMLHQNLSTIVRWYKGRMSFEARRIHADFAWQSRFHDHVIRDAENHEKIRYYILNNPLSWDKDRFNPVNR
jgi:hypothetical protein